MLRSALYFFTAFCFGLASTAALADFESAKKAFETHDYQTALKQCATDAESGDARCQNILGVLYATGQGVPQDYAEAARWYRKAADQGYSVAQNNLAVFYANGRGVPQSNIVAYAFYNLSATNKPSEDNNAISNRKAIANEMTEQEIKQGQKLSSEMSAPGAILKALDRYIKASYRTVKSERKTRKTRLAKQISSADSKYPAAPAAEPGFTTCRTQCYNGDCYRTYSNGSHVHFQAPMKWNPMNDQMEFDSGGC